MKYLALIPFAFLFVSCTVTAQKTPENMDAFISDLMSKMTLEEKIGQLNLPSSGDFTTGQAQSSDIGKKIENGQVGGLFNIKGVDKIRDVQKVAVEKSRLKIPLIFAMDIIHGYETAFPIPLGIAASWDMKASERVARISAQEGTADGIQWTFSPMVDISRDPRWGRIAESSGEDPYLTSQIARAFVRGYQGNDLAANNTMMACLKHFALYGAGEGGRDYNHVDMSRNRMFNEYFPPFMAAVEEGVGSIMTSFNVIDGIPASGNKWLLTEVLRDKWNFDGFVVTDYTAINEMIEHGMGDLQQVSAMSLRAGTDMDMVGEGFLTTIEKSLNEGHVQMADIDRAVRLVLEAKYKLGLFDDPYRYTDSERAKKEVFNAENRAEARKIAAETFVLLKNENQVLPLKTGLKVTLVGPLADAIDNMPGTWSVAARHDQSVSLKMGMKGKNFTYAHGANLANDREFFDRATIFGKKPYWDERNADALIAEAVAAAQNADVIVAAVGESSEMSGESSSMVNIDISASQKKLLQAMYDTGKPVVVVLFTGRAMTVSEENEKADAILNVWFGGTEAGNAIADVLYGNVNPSGKLPVSFPRSVGQIPIYYAGFNTGRPLNSEKTDDCKFEKFRSNYLDECNTPLFPFGYGLSYSKFNYGDLQLSSTNLSGNQTLKASVTVTNSGNYDGAEVVQLYIRDLVGSIARPVKELKGFEKVFLNKGESKTITFDITTEDLMFYNYDLDYVWEPGEFEIMIGTNSAEVQKKKIVWN